MRNSSAKVNNKEEKDKKRGLIFTLFFHVGILVMAFFPLMNAIEEKEEIGIEFVELYTPKAAPVNFVANAATKKRKNSSTKKAATKKISEKPTPPKPEPKPVPPPKSVETTNDDDALKVNTSNSKSGNVSEGEEEDVIKSTPKNDNSPKVVPSKNKATKNTIGGNAVKGNDNSGDGGNDEDLQEGIFGRKVMFRPNIKGLTKKKGRIAIKVCVSQEGTVIASKYIQKLSTIYDSKIVANAVRAARRYKFDVDYSSPKKQWGKLTFIFDLK